MSVPVNQKQQQKETQQLQSEGSGSAGSVRTASGMDSSKDSVKTADRLAFLASAVDSFMTRMGTPKRMASAEQTSLESRIYQLCGAGSAEDKMFVKLALVYNGIVHGTGPNADYSAIPFAPGGGCKAIKMSQMVDGIVTRKRWRKFMMAYGDLALEVVEASPALQDTLAERATRNGVPLTEVAAVIDFIPSTVTAPQMAGYRCVSKAASVARANYNEVNSQTKSAESAAVTSQEMSGRQAGRASNVNGDRYGSY